jgi:hypothetical protein
MYKSEEGIKQNSVVVIEGWMAALMRWNFATYGCNKD